MSGPARMLLTAALLALAGPVAAQTADCDRLYAAIQAADEPGNGGERWAQAAARQQSELDRTQSYADRLGCGHGLFGLGDPAACDSLSDRMGRMRDNLAALQDRAGRGRSADRAALLARYNEQCVGSGGTSSTDPGARGTLFDDGVDPRQFVDPDNPGPLMPEGEPPPEGTGRPIGQAICVRSCDGGWFPLGATATEDQRAGLDQLCQASCPNTEAHLFTMPRDGGLADAVGADGAGYTELPAAFKFQKEYLPACTCKPPNQSWTQALAKAEELLGDRDTHDIVVTAALSDQMARPGALPVPQGKPAGKTPRKGSASVPVATAPAAGSGDLASAATHDGQKAMQAPTASEATSGIGGPAQAERLVREGEGKRVTLPGPDGAKRTLRLIVP